MAPQLPLLGNESLQRPSALLTLLKVWSEAPALQPYLGGLDNSVLPPVFALLSAPHVAPTVVDAVLKMADNLLRALAGQPLRGYVPQRRALYLLATGPRHAVASWGPLTLAGNWVWRWKDRIDRRFIARHAGGG